MRLRIRRAHEDDAGAMAAVLNPLIEAGIYTVLDALIAAAEQAAFIRDFPARGVFHVAIAEDDGQLLGLQDVMPVSREPAFAHVREISTFVALGAHRRGVGRSLCEATFRAAAAQGFRKISATIRADNPGAIAFYQRQGFRRIGIARQHALVRGRYVDEILAEKLIG